MDPGAAEFLFFCIIVHGNWNKYTFYSVNYSEDLNEGQPLNNSSFFFSFKPEHLLDIFVL